MAILSLLSTNCAGLIRQRYKPLLPSKFPARVDYHRDVSLTPQLIHRMKINQKYSNHVVSTKIVTSASRSDHQNISYDDFQEEPFFLTWIKDALWDLKSLFVFLIEQPSQLKYIEWPSFSNTLRTATLTLVIVALLIIALSSVDSALCYLLALALRKSS